jgi:hypothetical protein
MQVSEEGCSISYRINSLRVILILINMDHTVNHLEDMLKAQLIVGIPIEQKRKILKHCNKQN